MHSDNSTKIVHFVRKDLGCQCGDNIFQKIEIVKNFELKAGIRLKYHINIGDRLLIYVIDAIDFVKNPSLIEGLLTTGITARNQNSFNRLRIVVINSDLMMQQVIQTVFTQQLIDDKIHLHFIENLDLDWRHTRCVVFRNYNNRV